MTRMQRPPKSNPLVQSQRESDIASIPSATESLYHRDMDSEVADAIGANPRCVEIMQKLLEQFPVTAAMTFAVAFGYMLRSQVEAERLVKVVGVTQ